MRQLITQKKYKKSNIFDTKICVVGLGYVGLPLLCLFAQSFESVGLDIDKERVDFLLHGNLTDNYDFPCSENNHSNRLKITTEYSDVKECDFYIITVPTPVDRNNHPDTSVLISASKSIGGILSKGDIVIYESTVSPGTTEEICIPLLESISGLKVNEDFSIGYSPERINVGDKSHQLANTFKIVSASNEFALETIGDVYQSILKNSVIKASSIKVAEASKMYENIQRDVLIALANEYADYCRTEGVDIYEVTKCAATKWNFSNVHPGLVGGHCIGVDPYYIIERSNVKKIKTPLIKLARDINENKSYDLSKRIIQLAYSDSNCISKLKILILGFSYKANVADYRNTKIYDLMMHLKNVFDSVDCYDPLVNTQKAYDDFGIYIISKLSRIDDYDIVVRAVNHAIFDTFNYSNCKKYIKIEDIL